MSSLKDILFGPQTNDPNQVKSVFGSAAQGFGAGIGKGFANVPNALDKQEKRKLEKQKQQLDVYQGLINATKVPPSIRGPIVKAQLEAIGVSTKEGPGKTLFDVITKADPNTMSLIQRAAASAGVQGVDPNQLFQTFGSDPSKIVEFLSKVSEGEQEGTAANVRTGLAQGATSPVAQERQGIQSQTLEQPGSGQALEFARQQAAGVRGKTGADLRGELATVLDPAKIEVGLRTRAANRTTGIPALDNISPGQAMTELTQHTTKPEVAAKSETVTLDDGRRVVRHRDAGGNVIREENLGAKPVENFKDALDIRRAGGKTGFAAVDTMTTEQAAAVQDRIEKQPGVVSSSNLVEKDGKRNLVLVDKAGNTKSIEVGDSNSSIAEMTADLSLVAGGKKPRFTGDKFVDLTPQDAKNVLADLANADPFKRAMAGLFGGQGPGTTGDTGVTADKANKMSLDELRALAQNLDGLPGDVKAIILRRLRAGK